MWDFGKLKTPKIVCNSAGGEKNYLLNHVVIYIASASRCYFVQAVISLMYHETSFLQPVKQPAM